MTLYFKKNCMPLVLFACLTSTSVYALESKPSFNCKKASNNVEKIICDVFHLGLSDSILAEKYSGALKILGKNSDLISDQKKWLKKRNTCEDKKCIKKAYNERIAELSQLVFQSRKGRYKLSNGWPTGVHTHIYTNTDKEKALCKTLENTLHVNEIKEPTNCGVLEKNKLQSELGATWKPVDRGAALTLVKQIYGLRKKKSQREHKWTDKEIAEYKELIEKKEIKISTTNIPLYGGQEIFEVIRVQRGVCENTDIPSVSALYAYRDNNKTILLTGLGNPNELFLVNDAAYLIMPSSRDFDDSFKNKLSPEQPILFIAKPSRGPGFGEGSYVRKCRFIFWDD